MGLVHLKVVDDWGSISYHIGGCRVDSARPPKKVLVKWPDKSETECDVRSAGHYETVSDMGHETTVHSTKLFVTPVYRGIKVWIPIEKVQVESSAFAVVGE